MSLYEAITIVLSSIALIVSIISYIRVTTLSSASIELTINERITTTKEHVNNLAIQMSALATKSNRTPAEEKQLKIYKHGYDVAIENNLNAYEEACAKYLDNKVDRKRFRKSYHVEIRQLVGNNEMKKYFDGVTSRYKAILKVYENWENLER